jgi:hypothetical protein
VKKVTKQKHRSLGIGQFKITGKEFFLLLVYPKTWLLRFLFLWLIFSLESYVTPKQLIWFIGSPMFLVLFIQLFYMLKSIKKLGTSVEKEYLAIAMHNGSMVIFMQPVCAFLSLPKEWLNNFFFLIPFVLLITILNVAAIYIFKLKLYRVAKDYRSLKRYFQ